MVAMGRMNGRWKDGYWCGWEEYRYGPKKKVTLAPIYKGTQRQHIIDDVMDSLKDWRSTPFEHEGAMRHGLRSALCLKGHRWARADFEAESLVAEGLSRIGAKRPSWEEGQREYSIPPENCSWCSRAIPDELMLSDRKVRFCSDVCAKSALIQRDFRVRRQEDAAYAAAYETIQRTRNSARDCKHCGKSFRPMFSGGLFCSHECSAEHNRYLEPITCPSCEKTFRPKNYSVKYCSRACTDVARRKLPLVHCAGCKEPFRPRLATRIFCSRACVDADKKKRQVECRCVCCGETFIGKSTRATMCSTRCTNMMYRRRHGGKPLSSPPSHVIHLTAEIFDGWFREAA